MQHFVHEKAICETSSVGKHTRIWAFAHVLKDAQIGADCNICDGVFIEGGAIVGDRVTVKCGVQLWVGVTLEDDVFVGPNATFTNDPFPRSKQYPEKYSETRVRKGASIGANATILPGLEIGANAMVGAGAVVTRSVPPNAIALGNPAKIVGYVGAEALSPNRVSPKAGASVTETEVQGVTIHTLPLVEDMRGNLSVGEFARSIPFEAKRYFLVFGVLSRDIRGEHAHRECHQFLICIAGNCSVVVDDGKNRTEVLLDRPNLGVYVPPAVWSVQYKYSSDAILLVFASHFYDPADYIRDYSEFLRLRLESR
jgi:acetyltransferase-like isoleucine patch superfamily enzyme/dTDP-4-dehydrorhamnose 3,5-epimerase-like enzyme